ncbi:hypothetical protein SNE40_005561 [Patella caerulea]|uniref:Uncharacterized protein n=1 Tax=Patella caerulea TaxID=87958 RepID=A0AAN8K865_PATCE
MIDYSSAKDIISGSDFREGEFEAIRKYAIAPQAFRQKIIKSSKSVDEVWLCAAIEIQRRWRGYRGRCNIFGVYEPILSNVAVYSSSVTVADRLKDAEEDENEPTPPSPSQPPTSVHPSLPQSSPEPPVQKPKPKPTMKKSHALRRLERYYKEYVKEEKEKETRAENIFRFAEFCAAFIQKWWRALDLETIHAKMLRDMVQEEVEYEEEEEFEETAEDEDGDTEEMVEVKKPKEKKEKVKKTRTVKKTKVVQKKPENVKEVVYAAFQQHIKGLKDERDRENSDRNVAACKIQRQWRRHIDVQVYRYYRDLINFKTQGDPAMMLRCINPNESKLLDPAIGVHVRFRLAGDRFPPNIYYKIFTHRPIVDMCANSPKDYTSVTAKQSVAFDRNNRARQNQLGDRKDKSGWYQRVENNGWRLVSDRLIHHIMSDPVTWESSKKKYEFHHDKLHRKQDVEKRRKKKKIDWMKMMYKEGMLKARSRDIETVKLIEGAAGGMVATIDNIGPEALEEWEVDELLDWTTSLNFEDYWTGWKDLATSAHSEQRSDERRRVYSDLDPYELTLSSSASRHRSTRQSQNSPVSVIR